MPCSYRIRHASTVPTLLARYPQYCTSRSRSRLRPRLPIDTPSITECCDDQWKPHTARGSVFTHRRQRGRRFKSCQPDRCFRRSEAGFSTWGAGLDCRRRWSGDHYGDHSARTLDLSRPLRSLDRGDVLQPWPQPHPRPVQHSRRVRGQPERPYRQRAHRSGPNCRVIGCGSTSAHDSRRPSR